MMIYEDEKIAANELVCKLLKHKEKLPYINIGSNNEYLGWVTDFKLKDTKDISVSLDLKKEKDLFLLFILAIIWSRTGIWENSAFFVSYLKIYKKDIVDFWRIENNFRAEEEERKQSADLISRELRYHVPPRKKISFRRDVFKSINILAQNWQRILDNLDVSEKQQDFKIFMKFMRSIKGLGIGDHKILIKIPLILRELRCQKIYNHISGELCCVTDDRVIKAGKSLGIRLSKPLELKSLIDNSSRIYSLFGNLYDLPLFAFEDLKNMD